MTEKKIYQLAFANFLCAFGGGAVLGQATKLVLIAGKPVGSIFAFFIGTTIGLFLMEIVAAKFSEKAPRWYSLWTLFCSLGIYSLLQMSPEGTLEGVLGVIALGVLSFRFCFWFLSRIFRSNIASSAPRLLPLFEGSYVGGSILGLLLFGIVFKQDIGINEILFLDVFCSFLAFVIDYPALKQEKSLQGKQGNFFKSLLSREIYPPLFMFCLISIGVQVCLFQLSKFWKNGLVLIIGFYSGMALASVLVAKLKIESKENFSFFKFRGRKFKIGFISMSCFLLFFVTLFYISQNFLAESALGMFLMSLLFAMVYEVFALALVQNISTRSRNIGFINPVARSYAIMALCSAVAIAFYIGFDLSASQIFYISIFLLGFSFTLNFVDRKNLSL